MSIGGSFARIPSGINIPEDLTNKKRGIFIPLEEIFLGTCSGNILFLGILFLGISIPGINIPRNKYSGNKYS